MYSAGSIRVGRYIGEPVSYPVATVIACFDEGELWFKMFGITHSSLIERINFSLKKFWHQWKEEGELGRRVRIILEFLPSGCRIQKIRPHWDVDFDTLCELTKSLNIAVKGYNIWNTQRKHTQKQDT